MSTDTLPTMPTKTERLAVPADAIVVAETGKPFVMFSRRSLKVAVADALNDAIVTLAK